MFPLSLSFTINLIFYGLSLSQIIIIQTMSPRFFNFLWTLLRNLKTSRSCHAIMIHILPKFLVITIGEKYRQSHLFYSCLFLKTIKLCSYQVMTSHWFDENAILFLSLVQSLDMAYRSLMLIFLIIRRSLVDIEGENCHNLLILIFLNRNKILSTEIRPWSLKLKWITERHVRSM